MATMKLSALDKQMRHDGFVTIREVGAAMGMTSHGVRKAVEEGRMPGKRVESPGGAYGHWYVDIKKLLAQLPADGPTETRAALQVLARSAR